MRALYRASQRGVTIDLIVRDTCRLRPGLDGVSSSIKVVSVIGRFLEHARIYYFHNGGRAEYYLGSADAMQRNLEKRVEVLVPDRGSAPAARAALHPRHAAVGSARRVGHAARRQLRRSAPASTRSTASSR